MQNEFVSQYSHTWRVFTRLVNGFDDNAWIHTGRNSTTPVRLSLHMLQAIKYYIEDHSTTYFMSGKAFDMDSETAKEDDLPSRSDILSSINVFLKMTDKWLTEIDYGAKNEASRGLGRRTWAW